MGLFWEGGNDGVRGRCSTFKAAPLMRNQDVRNPYSMFVNLTLCIMGSAWLSGHEPYHRAAINYPLYGLGDLSDENMVARQQINFKLLDSSKHCKDFRCHSHFGGSPSWCTFKSQGGLGGGKLISSSDIAFWQRYQGAGSKPISGRGSCGKMQPLALSLSLSGTQCCRMRRCGKVVRCWHSTSSSSSSSSRFEMVLHYKPSLYNYKVHHDSWYCVIRF